MSNYVLESLRSEQSQIDTLLEVLEERLNGNLEYCEALSEAIESLDSFEDLGSVEGVPSELADEIIDAVRDRIMESVLSIETITTKRILLGCGGPTRYIEINFNEDNEIIGGEYFDNSKAMHDPLEQEERYLTCDEAEAFAYRYNLID